MRTILITGWSDGLWKLVAEQLRDQGDRVVCLSRSQPSEGILHIPTDLMDDDSITQAVVQIQSDYVDFDAVINCAGVFVSDPVDAISAEHTERCLRINTVAPLLLISQLRDQIVHNVADIVNVGSTLSRKWYTSQAAYGASKRALRGLNENLRLELKWLSNRLIEFYPGGFQSEFVQKFTGEQAVDLSKYMKPEYLADSLIFALNLPKNIEISQMVINRK